MEYYNYIEDMNIDVSCTGEQRLCIAVILQAVKDIHYRSQAGYTYSIKAHKRLKESAIQWIKSESEEPFSFLWCLEHAFPDLYDTLDIDYIIRIVLTKPLKCKRSTPHLSTSRSNSLYIKQ